jgi:hypothetical protein
MSATTWLCSLAASFVHTLRLASGRMFLPPGFADSLEACDQLFKSVPRQQRRFGPWRGAQVRAGDGDENVLASTEFNVAVTHAIGSLRCGS